MALDPDRYALVADTGGTNTRVALAEGSRLLPQTVRRYANAAHGSLAEVLETFLADQGGVDCAAAAVAVAGPVRDGRGTLTNLDWAIDEATVARAAKAERVAVLNDLQAQGHALGHLGAGALAQIVPGAGTAPGQTRLVIGIGTGFNVAPVHEGAFGRLVAPAEAGHVTLPVRDEAGLSLARFLAREHGFASVEDALSGRGLAHLYAWLGAEAGDPREADSGAILAALGTGSDPRAEQAVRLFVQLLGAVAGDLALTMLPFGGIFLAGGMARAMAPHLARFGFAAAFRDKGRFSRFMEDFGVWVIEDDFAALHGLAHHLARLPA
ncbi:MAG: glucokinase [Rhodobacteraceae bacterium]|nr:glucokinase [Paracoccaceae bacterium]